MLCQATLEPEIKRKIVSPYTCLMCFLTSFLQNMRVIEKIKSMYNSTHSIKAYSGNISLDKVYTY